MTTRTVAVIGAGNVGHAFAADLALRGVEVRLHSRAADRLAAIRQAGGITAAGEIEGLARPALLTGSMREATEGADVIAVCVPTAALPLYADELFEASTSEQVMLLNPGHTGGGLYLSGKWSSPPRKLCQLTTASHVSRMSGPAAVTVLLRPKSKVASVTPQHSAECYAVLDELFAGQFGRATSILEVDLANINAMLHPAGMICNAGWIEATQGDFGFYSQGTGAAVSHVIDALDQERLALAVRLGVEAVPFPQLMNELGFCRDPEASDAQAAIESSDLIYPIKAPTGLDHRYLHEDVGWGLVPWIRLARSVGMDAPTMTALAHMAQLLTGVDYFSAGATAS
ncbi:MAG: NAD/NADP octopine/nopaline dehydrogenase family protein [Marmoricola sp.]